ncbi:hypothetical protein LWM68_05725 [Niabella sp. W65]|nr:hypothetical protein [Niabella sp. W65]MCH7362305.1 hypothetical protein [Niabella sp. W65]ULT38281.1 hypothetical protein KRR40_24335 [Niabella sp. I65]
MDFVYYFFTHFVDAGGDVGPQAILAQQYLRVGNDTKQNRQEVPFNFSVHPAFLNRNKPVPAVMLMLH